MRAKKTNQKKRIYLCIALFFLLILFLIFQTNKNSMQERDIIQDFSAANSSYPSDTPTTTNTEPTSVGTLDSSFEEALAAITQALQAPNASQLQPLLQNDIILGDTSGNISSESGNKTAVLAWLANHWGSKRQYISKNYVEHFGYWEIETRGWSNVPSEKVFLRLFKYDNQGMRTVQEGTWMIYAVLFPL